MTQRSKKIPLRKALRPYWRFEYSRIAHESTADPFRGLKTANEKKSLVVIKGKVSCLILNRFPYNAGHLLAIPYRAVGALEDLTGEESGELMDLVVAGKLLLQKALKADGVNIGMNQGDGAASGGSVPGHLHWHIIPRWRGDHNFFPLTAGVSILVRSQESVWRALREEYGRVK